MATDKTKRAIEGNGFRNLLFFLLLYIVGSPFLEPYASLAIFAHLSLSNGGNSRTILYSCCCRMVCWHACLQQPRYGYS